MSLRHIAGLFVQNHIVAIGQGADKVVHLCGNGRLTHFLVGGGELTVPDVVGNGAVIQPGFLQNHTKQRTQVVPLEGANIIAVYQNGAVVDVIEPHQKLHHRGFACTGRADNRHLLAGFDIGAEIMDDDFFRIVTKAHMSKLHAAFNVDMGFRIRLFTAVYSDGVFCHGNLFFPCQELKHPLCSSHGLLENVGYIGHLGNGLSKLPHILDKSLNIAYANPSIDGEPAAHNADHHIAHITDKVHHRHHQAGKELGFPCGLIQTVVILTESLFRTFLAVKSLYHHMAAIHLLHMAIDVTQIFLLLHEIFLRLLDNEADKHHGNRHNEQRYQRHFPADGEHHGKNTDEHGDRSDNLGNALVQTLTDGVHIVGDAGKHFAVGGGVIVRKRETVDFIFDVPAQAIGDLHGNAGHDKTLNIGTGGADEVQAYQKQQDFPNPSKVNAFPSTGNCPYQSLKELGSSLAQNFRTEDGQHGGGCGKEQYHQNGPFIASQIMEQLFKGSLEVLGFFAGHHAGTTGAMTTAGTAHHAPCGASAGSFRTHSNSSFES